MLQQLGVYLVSRAPDLLRIPLKVTPSFLQYQVLESVLNWQFRQALQDGELAFLENRWLKVEVQDLSLCWYMSVQQEQLVVRQWADADVTFSGCANDLILIAARKEDPDTLFFQRRLRVEGDTELGLYVKNLMDATNFEMMPPLLRAGLLQLAEWIEVANQQKADANSDTVKV